MIKKSKKRGNISLFLFLLPIALFMALPLVYVVNNAFKPLDEMFLFPPRFFTQNPTMANFKGLFRVMSNSWVPFSRYIFNSLFITIVSTTGHIFLASMAAYPLAKHKFPFRNVIFSMVVLSLMFSNQVTSVPNYLIMKNLKLIDTYFAIILPAFVFPLGLFLLKQFMEGLPDSIIEAANLDGASEIKTWWMIVLPSIKPAWLTLILFCFQNLWAQTGDNFIYSEQIKTLPSAFNQIIGGVVGLGGGVARQGVSAAAAFVILLVPITIFILTQSNIIETMTSSGLKE